MGALSDAAPLIQGIVDRGAASPPLSVLRRFLWLSLSCFCHVLGGAWPWVDVDVGVVAPVYRLCRVVLRCLGVGFSLSGDLVVHSRGV